MSAAPSEVPHPSGLPPAPGWPIHPAMVTSSFDLPGFRIERSLGIVRGLTVRSPGIGGGLAASFQAMGGGAVKTFIDLCERAREEAFLTMMQHAVRFGANAVVCFRYDTTEIGQGMTEVLAYGTAVYAARE